MTSMSDEWYEKEFKLENNYRKLKPKKCCTSCKHAYVVAPSYYDCYADTDESSPLPFPVDPFAICDKYEPRPKEENK